MLTPAPQTDTSQDQRRNTQQPKHSSIPSIFKMCQIFTAEYACGCKREVQGNPEWCDHVRRLLEDPTKDYVVISDHCDEITAKILFLEFVCFKCEQRDEEVREEARTKAEALKKLQGLKLEGKGEVASSKPTDDGDDSEEQAEGGGVSV